MDLKINIDLMRAIAARMVYGEISSSVPPHLATVLTQYDNCHALSIQEIKDAEGYYVRLTRGRYS